MKKEETKRKREVGELELHQANRKRVGTDVAKLKKVNQAPKKEQAIHPDPIQSTTPRRKTEHEH